MSRNIEHYSEQLERLRALSRNDSIDSLLSGRSHPELSSHFNDLVRLMWRNSAIALHPSQHCTVASSISEELWQKAKDYSELHFKSRDLTAMLVVELLLAVFAPQNATAWYSEGILHDLCPELQFDSDGLLEGPMERLSFTKEGILYGKYFIMYHVYLPETGMTDGFVASLLELKKVKDPHRFSLKFSINESLVLDRTYYGSTETRAYHYGPIGISPARLRSPAFPQKKSGVVTAHVRDSDASRLLHPIQRTEIMWSERSGVKTVQIEELRDRQNSDSTKWAAQSRYAHARWNVEKEEFEHFDGAIRRYDSDEYESRLESDLNGYSGKAKAYKKLFRIDGVLGFEEWSHLVVRFFSGNDLVAEYLQAEFAR